MTEDTTKVSHAELEERVKRARIHWERESAFEKECLQNTFASHQHHLERAIASRDERLTAAEEESSGLRDELWKTRAALQDAGAQLAARPVVGAAASHEDPEDQEGRGELVLAAVEDMQEQLQICEEASPKARCYYYPQSASALPHQLQGLSQNGLAQAIAGVKEWMKGRALIKRAKTKAGDEDSA